MPWLRRTRSALPAVALALLLPALDGCFDAVGITCPKEDPFCDVPRDLTPAPDLADLGDFAVVDLSLPPDLTLLPDLTLVPDLTTCAASCVNGCCDSAGVCHAPTTLEACGAAGAKCLACDSARADTCHSGACQCGSNPPCGDGNRCVNGACVCDATSCPGGCCDDAGRCWQLAVDHCGVANTARCTACNPLLADGCKSGCTCGTSHACVDGQHCLLGKCVCDATSCTTGCCAGETCTPPSLTACGALGAACVTCDPLLADHCTTAGCACGTLAVGGCKPGQHCLNGACMCDAMSCRGCCYGDYCAPGNNVQTCGINGVVCQVCAVGMTSCLAGVCAP
jgi:hypothetical protein